MLLLIDDVRDLAVDAIARTAEAGKKLLAMGGWTHLYLDHDLGDASDETGYGVLVWALEFDHVPYKVTLVTSNPPGRMRMQAALENAGYTTLDGIRFEKE